MVPISGNVFELLSTPMWTTPLKLDCWFSVPLYINSYIPIKWLGFVLPLLSKSHHWWYPSIDCWWTARNIIDHLCLNTHQIVGGYVTFHIPMYLPFVHILSTIFPHFRFYRLWITSIFAGSTWFNSHFIPILVVKFRWSPVTRLHLWTWKRLWNRHPSWRKSEPYEPWSPWSPPQPEPTKRHYEWCYLQLKKHQLHLLMIVFG